MYCWGGTPRGQKLVRRGGDGNRGRGAQQGQDPGRLSGASFPNPLPSAPL